MCAKPLVCFMRNDSPLQRHFIYAIDRDAAAIALVDSNLQREHILPSGKAYASQMEGHSGKPSYLTGNPQLPPRFGIFALCGTFVL